jgi:chromosome segregation ATPase
VEALQAAAAGREAAVEVAVAEREAAVQEMKRLNDVIAGMGLELKELERRVGVKQRQVEEGENRLSALQAQLASQVLSYVAHVYIIYII